EILLVRTWNEGLADFYGASYSRMPTFMISSIDWSHVRQVDLAPKQIMGRDYLQTGLQMKPQRCFRTKETDPYYNGEQISRVLYAISSNDEFPAIGKDGEKLNKWDRGVRYVHYRLQSLNAELRKKFAGKPEDQKWLDIDPELILSFLLQDLPL